MTTDQQLTPLGNERFNVPAILRFIDAEAKSVYGGSERTQIELVARLVRALDLARRQAQHERDCAAEKIAQLSELLTRARYGFVQHLCHNGKMGGGLSCLACEARLVPSTKIGRCWLFPGELLRKWMAGEVRMRTGVDLSEVFSWAKRRAGLSERTPAWADLDAITRIYIECRRTSRNTGVEHHVDHIVPLQGRAVSGLHVENNLQILPATQNIAKGNRL